MLKILLLFFAGFPTSPQIDSPNNYWKLLDRTVIQDGGDWRIDYRLIYGGPIPTIITTYDMSSAVESLVSNSRIKSHSSPKKSTLKVNGASTSISTIVNAFDVEMRCEERLILQVYSYDGAEPPSRKRTDPPELIPPLKDVTITPGGLLGIRLRLDHEHFIYGFYDPLLGIRDIKIKISDTTIKDTINLEKENFVNPKIKFEPPPDDRLDTHLTKTSKSSLYLEAHANGNQSYKFRETQIRYSTKYRLSFWYLIAPRTEGEFRVRIGQYKESPNGWQVLHGNAFEQTYSKVGKWTKVDHIIQTSDQTTSFALEFRIYGGVDVGEVWIDGISLDPIRGSNEIP